MPETEGGSTEEMTETEETPQEAEETALPAQAGLTAEEQGWFDSLSEELKKEASLQSFKGKDIGDVVKSYVEAQKLIGSSIRIPKKDAPREEWDKFWEKMGRPKTAEEYKIEKPSNLPEGIVWNDGMAARYKSVAHSLGLSKAQVEGFYKWYMDEISRQASSIAEKQAEVMEFARAKTEEQMRNEWGPDYKRRLTIAKRGLLALGDKDLINLIETSGLGNHPSFLRLFYNLGQKYAESGMIEGTVEGALTPAEAKERIKEIVSNPGHLYHPQHAGKPGHKEAVLEMEKLHKIAYGT